MARLVWLTDILPREAVCAQLISVDERGLNEIVIELLELHVMGYEPSDVEAEFIICMTYKYHIRQIIQQACTIMPRREHVSIMGPSTWSVAWW